MFTFLPGLLTLFGLFRSIWEGAHPHVFVPVCTSVNKSDADFASLYNSLMACNNLVPFYTRLYQILLLL